jgi:hypothetical protein
MGSKVTDVLTTANDIWGGPNKVGYDIYSEQKGMPNIGGSPSRAGALGTGNPGNPGESGGMGWMDYVGAALPVAGAAANYFMTNATTEEGRKNAEESKKRAEDTDVRREATYRGNRGMLQSAIADFYKQKGWAMPEMAEGAYTSRALPGEKPIYGDTTMPQADWYYGPKEEAADEAAAVAPLAEIDTQSPIFNTMPSPQTAPPLSYANPVPAQAVPLEDSDSYKKLLRSYGY